MISDARTTRSHRLRVLMSTVLLAAVAWHGPVGIEAMPANRKVWTFTQPDGTKFQAVLRGDEFHAYRETPEHQFILQDPKTGYWHYAIPQADGSLQITTGIVGKTAVKTSILNKDLTPWLQAVEKLADQRAQTLTGTFRAKAQAPSTGTVKGVMLLANFSDTLVTFSTTDFNNLLNQTGYNANGAAGSVKDYYLEASYGKLTLQTDVYGWFNLPNTLAYYGANDALGNDLRPLQMITDAISASNATVDYANYDADGDGWVDFFGVIHQGQGEEQSGASADCIWSHRASLSGPISVDGKQIQDYHTEPEKFYSSLSTIGVFCHEMGHFFGLPDLYDTTYASAGLGMWSVMADGTWGGPGGDGSKPVHFDPWCKMVVGWLTPTHITANQSGLALGAFDQNEAALLLPVSPNQSGEFFLITNRYARATASAATGFEQYLPGSGALVLHVEDYIKDNDIVARKKVDVEEADGLGQLDAAQNSGDAGDLYRFLSSAFNDTSNPSSRDNGGNPTSAALSNFTGAGTPTMTLDIVPRANLSAMTLSYDPAGASEAKHGFGDGSDFGCVRFSMPTPGILKGIRTYFNYTGVTQYSVDVYPGWTGTTNSGTPSGTSLATKSGQHTGVGAEEIMFTTPPSIPAGDFYLVVRYSIPGGHLKPLPLARDVTSSGRSYISNTGSTYSTLASYSLRGNLNIRAIYTPIDPPTLSSFTRLDANPTAPGTVAYRIDFSREMMGGSPSNFALTTSGAITGATIAGVTGTGATRTVQVNTGSGLGTIWLDLANSTGLTDLFGLSIATLLPALGPVYDISLAAATVSSITRLNGSPTNAASVGYTVQFSKAMTGVDPSDFTLSTTAGQTGATIGGVSGSGSTYAVTVNTVAADGTLRLDLSDNDTIVDANNVPLGGPGAGNGGYTTAASYSVDRTDPAINSQTPASGSILATLSTVKVSFNETVTGVAKGDLKVNGSPATSVSGSGAGPYTFSGFANPADGTVIISLAAGAITDGVGNPPIAESYWTVTKLSAPPLVTLSSGNVTNGGAAKNAPVFTATFNRGVNNFVAADITVTNGSVAGFSGSGAVYSFTVNPSANGNVSVKVAASVATDASAPYLPNTASATYSFQYDTVAPTGTVVINNNAAWTSSTAVTLKLTAVDNTSGISQMRISKDGIWNASTPWMTYAASKAWQLVAGEGYNRVVVQLADRAGNLSASFSDTINQDTLPPQSQLTTPADNSTLTTSSFTLRWSRGDTMSGVRSVRIVWRKSGGTTATLAGSPFPSTQTSVAFKGTGIGTYSFYSIATDQAGNVEPRTKYDIWVQVTGTKSATGPTWVLYE